MYRVIDSRWGPCKVLEKDEYVGRSVIAYGEYGPDETEKILELAGDGLCVDIGANIGCISMALEASGRTVMAIEPQPEVFGLLRENVRGECLNIALGNEHGNAIMPKVSYSSRGNFGGMEVGGRSIYGTINVKMEILDSLVLKDVSFIKIDVEGFERQVLLGGRETIARCRPIMYIEDDRMDKRSGLRETLTKMGYSYELHTPSLYREENHFGLKKNIWDKNYVSVNLICRPIC